MGLFFSYFSKISSKSVNLILKMYVFFTILKLPYGGYFVCFYLPHTLAFFGENAFSLETTLQHNFIKIVLNLFLRKSQFYDFFLRQLILKLTRTYNRRKTFQNHLFGLRRPKYGYILNFYPSLCSLLNIEDYF